MQDFRHLLEGIARRRIGPLVSFLLTLLALCVGVSSSHAFQRVASGSYVGNNTPDRVIPVGFEPDFVMVKSSGNEGAVVRIDTMPDGESKPIGHTGSLSSSYIRGFTADGFTIGDNKVVNQSGVTYHWTAMQGDAENLVTGSYLGNGVDNRNINDLGITPTLVMVFPAENHDGSFRLSTMTSGWSMRFGPHGLETDHIQQLVAGGFQVGRNNRVNDNGKQFYYIAWTSNRAEIDGGVYQGNGADGRDIACDFDPEFLLIKNNGSWAGVHRSDSSLGDVTFAIDSDPDFSNGVQSLGAEAFEIGSHWLVNWWSEYYTWVAFSSTPLPEGAEIAVEIAADTGSVEEGDSLRVRMTVPNDGPHDANVELLVEIPVGFSYVSGTPDAGTFVPGTGGWTIAPLQAGEAAHLELVLRALEGHSGTTQTFTISISSSSEPDSDPGDDSASVDVDITAPPEADIQIEKSVDVPEVNEGDTFFYTVVATNLGPAVVPTLQVADPLPSGFTLRAATPATGSYANGVWEVGSLGVGGRVGLVLEVEAEAGTAGTTITNIASVGDSPLPDPDPDNDSAAVDVRVLGSDLALTHTVVPEEANPGDEVVYTTTVSNLGPDKSGEVVVKLSPPEDLTYLHAEPSVGTYHHGSTTWTIPETGLSVAETLVWTGKVGDEVSGTLTSTAEITSATPADPNPGNEADSALLLVVQDALSLTLTVDEANPAVGDGIRYDIVVRNGGSQSAVLVTVVDDLPGEVRYLSQTILGESGPLAGSYDPGSGLWSVGDLAPGASAELLIDVEVREGTEGVTFANSAAITGPILDGDDPADNEDSVDVTVRGADLSVSQVPATANLQAGIPSVLTITVGNGGPDRATGVVVPVEIPSLLDRTGVVPDVGSFDLPTGIWTVGDLAVGETEDLVLTLTPKQAAAGSDLVVNSAVSAGDPSDPDPSNDEAESELHVLGADLAVTQVVSDPIVVLGDPVDFVITLRNRGPDDASAIVVRDLLPSGLDYESASASSGSYDPATGRWDLSSVGHGAQAQLVLTAIVNTTSTVVNTATRLSSTPTDFDSRNDSDSEEVGTVVADLSVEVGVSGSVLFEGTSGSLTVSVQNLGPNEATDVIIEESFPAELTLAGSSVSHGNYDPAFGYWSIPVLAEGQTATLTLNVDAPLGSEGSWTQEASLLSSGQVDPENGNDADTIGFEVRAEVDLSVTLEAAPSTVREEETVTLTVTLSNEGPSPATGPAVHLGYDDALVWNTHTPSQGTFDPVAGTWIAGTIAAEGSASLEVEVRAAAGSSGTVASVSASVLDVDQPDTDGSNDSAEESVTIASGLLVAASQTAGTLLPGADPIPLLTIVLTNASMFDESLETLTAMVRTTGSGSEADLLAEWQTLDLWFSGALLATAEPAASVTFTGLGLALSGGASRTLEIRAGASLAGKDGDELDLFLADETSLGFSRAVPLEAVWPLDPAGSFVVDGLVAAQVTTHALPVGTLEAGGDPVLVADLTLPGNGYDTDVLESFGLIWSGTAEPGDLGEFTFWRDGGDGVLGGDDVLLGTATPIGDVWSFSGLAEPVPTTGIRIFALATASEDAVVGHSFSFQLGLGSAQMSSGNDGPHDEPVAVSGVLTIGGSDDPVVTIAALARNPLPLLPGAAPTQMLRVRVENAGPGSILLDSLVVHDGSEVDGTADDSDASWSKLELVTTDAFAEPQTNPQGTMSGGSVRFGDLGVVIEEGSSAELTVLGAASLLARDGDALQLRLEGSGDLAWSGPVSVQADWPLASAAPTPVDGMAAGQVTMVGLQGRHVSAGTEDLVVAQFRVPANGYAEDLLESIALVNFGDATSVDLAGLELLVGETSLGLAGSSDGRWIWSGLDRVVPVDGILFTVQADIDSSAVPGHTLRFGLPAMPSPGLTMASGNDGPRDASASHVAMFEIAPREGAVAVSVSAEIGVSLLPGDVAVELLRLRFSNETVEAETLEALSFDLDSSGFGEVEEIAAGWSEFELWLESSLGGDPTVDPGDEGGPGGDGTGDGADVSSPVLVGTAAVNADDVVFEDLALVLGTGASFELTLRGGASLDARDGDRLDPRLLAEGMGWGRETDVVALGTLDPPGDIVVDGMSAGQITLFPVEEATFEAGSQRNLALDLIAPANGYAPDVLERFNLKVEGSAGRSDLSAFELWSDDGDGIFLPDSDLLLGELTPTGDRWEITGLDLEVPVPGQRLFVTVDVSDAALESRSFELLLPSGDDVALGMASGNDGPRDLVVGDGRQHVISSVDRVSLAARTIPSGTVRPGQTNVPLLHLFATNTYLDDRTIEGLTVRSRATGPGRREELDLAFDLLLLYEDADGDGRLRVSSDRVLAAGSFEDGVASFGNLDWTLPAAGSGSLFLVGRVSSRWAHDGDELAVELSDPLDLDFVGGATSVTGSWPLSSGSRWIVDGMVAAQIGTSAGGTRAAGPGQGPILAFDFTLPANGYLDDQLESLVLENTGSALDEIGALGLWQDGGDGRFSQDESDDLFVGSFVPSGSRWILEGLSVSLGLDENRFFAGLTAAEQLEDSVSVALRIPREGVQVVSGNDGPHDEDKTSPISLLLSNAPLLANLSTDPGASNIDQTFLVTLDVENRSEEQIESIAPRDLEVSGSGRIVLVSGPTPAALDLAPGESGTFTWVARGSEPGTVEFEVLTEGWAESDGAPLRSLQATSAPHDLRVGAEGLTLFALGSLPVTLSYGQQGVVPLSFTFRNPGEVVGSDIELDRIRIRLESQPGAPVVPGELIQRAIVSEGSRVYYSSTSLPLEGDLLDLVFATPVVITTLEPTTLNLRFDLAEISSYDSYRVVIEEASWFSALDGTSRVGVGVELAEGDFPLVSGLARLVSEATAVGIRGFVEEDLRLGPGAGNVPVLTFEATAGGGSGAGADSRLGSFAVTVIGADGAPLASAGDWIEQIHVRTPLQDLLSSGLGATTSGDSIAVRLSSPLTLPANTPVPITLSVDFRTDVEPGELRFELEDAGSIDARDSNTGGPVPVVYESTPIVGPNVRVEAPSTELWVSGNARLPEQVSVGTRSLHALDLVCTHPGSVRTSRARIGALTFQLWNQDRSGLVPNDYLSRIEVRWDGEIVGDVSTFPETGAAVTVPITAVTLESGETAALEVRIGIESTAPTGWLELTVGATQISAVDVNAGGPLQILPKPGTELPVFSGLSRVTAPARELSVELGSLVPAALVRDGSEVTVAELVLGHPSTDGTGPIQVEEIVLRGADAGLSELLLGEVVSEVRAYLNEEIWDAAVLGEEEPRAVLAGDLLELVSGDELRLELRAIFRGSTALPALRFGMQQQDIGVVQPEGALFEIEPRAKSGAEFPLWTELGSFGPIDLGESYANFPNPFAAGHESTTFVYYLPSDGVVDLRIWTLRGDEVVTLLSGAPATAGLHQEVVWDGSNGTGRTVRNGVYLAELEVRMSGRSERFLRKVAVVR